MCDLPLAILTRTKINIKRNKTLQRLNKAINLLATQQHKYILQCVYLLYDNFKLTTMYPVVGILLDMKTSKL